MRKSKISSKRSATYCGKYSENSREADIERSQDDWGEWILLEAEMAAGRCSYLDTEAVKQI